MATHIIDIFTRSIETMAVTEKRRVHRDIRSGEILEIWVNDRLEYEYLSEQPWPVEPSKDKEWKTKW